MTPLLSRGLALALGVLVSLTHAGCSEELVLKTQSGRETFELGETVVIQVFDGKRVTDAQLGSVRFRWEVRNTTSDDGYTDVGEGAELITSQLKPGKNWVYVNVENDPNYRFPPSGGIAIYVTENGVLPAPKPTPSFDPDASTAPAATAAPDPAPAPAASAPDPQPAAAKPASAGLIGGMNQ